MKSEHVKILVREIEDAREYKGYSGRYRGGEATDAVVVSDPDDKGRAQEILKTCTGSPVSVRMDHLGKYEYILY